jgi:uncharacterized ParB-like nuclease family protein
MAVRVRLRLAEIIRDSRIQPRERINGAVVDEYAETMAKASSYEAAGLPVLPFPPIVVFQDQDEDGRDLYWLADGWHRLLAAEQAGHEEVEAEVAVGDRDAALFYAAGANAQHGLRRSQADRRRAVRLLLDHPTVIAEQWGNGQIAHHTGVTAWLVRDVRAKREADLGLAPQADRRGRDGKLYHGALQLRGAGPVCTCRDASSACGSCLAYGPRNAQESPLVGSGGPKTPEAASDTGTSPQRLLIHQCRTDGCDAVTAEPCWHCATCGAHWPLAEGAEALGCPRCVQARLEAVPVPIFAQVTAVDVPKSNGNGHGPQAAYTPGRLGPPPSSLALERLRGALDLLDTALGAGVTGADLLAACDDPDALWARLKIARAALDRVLASAVAV